MWAVGGPDDDDAGDPLVDAVEMVNLYFSFKFNKN